MGDQSRRGLLCRDWLDSPAQVPADAVRFHCQQAAEKYIKALLQDRLIRFRKTHDLEQLLQSASSVEPGLLLLANAMTLLSEYSVRYRYPGVSALPKQAKAAVAAAKQVRIAILPLLKK